MRNLVALSAVLTLLAVQVMAPVASGVESPSTPAAPAAPRPSPPALLSAPASGVYAGIDRIVLIVMENHSYAGIVNNPSAPYLNSLIRGYGLATNYTGVAHPSQPNYIALFSGSTQGVTDDNVHDLAGRNLADQLEARGKTWRVVAENVPLGCYRDATFYGGADGAGWYARKHEPAITFNGIAGNASRCARITNLRHFSLTAADFQMIVPNMCNSMHDCSVATGDAFLKRFVTRVSANAASAHTLVMITFDEGTDSAGGGGRVATILVGPMVRKGFRSTVAHNHYSLLRTIENVWSLGCLKNSCAAKDLREFFGG
jgi:hypothetical protein